MSVDAGANLPSVWQEPLRVPEFTPDLLAAYQQRLDAERGVFSAFAYDYQPIDLSVLCQQPEQQRASRFGAAAKGTVMGGVVLASILPSEGVQAQTTPETPVDREPQIVFVGDSIGAGMREYGNFASQAEEAELNLSLYDAVSGRRLVLPGCELDTPSTSCINIGDGIRVLQANPRAIEQADVILLELGTNDSAEDMYDNLLRNVRTAHTLGSTDGRPPVILVPEMFYTTDYGGGAEAKNDAIRQVLATSQAEGIDVRMIPLRNLNIPMSDGMHPTGSGSRQLADALLDNVTALNIDTDTVPTPAANPASSDESPGLLDRIVTGLSNLPGRIFGNDDPSTLNIDEALNSIDVNSLWPSVTQQTTNPEATRAVNQPVVVTPPALAQPNSPQAPVSEQPVVNLPEAARDLSIYGVSYDNGQYVTYLGNFTDNNTLTVNEGFADQRDVGNGTYRQGNADFSTGGESRPLLAPAPGIVHIDETSGEGIKVTLELGADGASGESFTWYATHLASVNVEEGDIVLPGEILGMSGDTGTAFGIHNSVGVAIQSVDELDEYLNSSEALNPFDYFSPTLQIVCGPDAKSDDIELCGPTDPGYHRPIPLHPRVVEYLLALTGSASLPLDIEAVLDDMDLGQLWEDISNTPSVPIPNETPVEAETPEPEIETPSSIPEPEDNDEQPDTQEDPPFIVDETPIVLEIPKLDWDNLFTDLTDPNDPANRPVEEVQPSDRSPVGFAPNAYGAEAPLLNIFTPELLQSVLPEAPADNIMRYAPLIMSALHEFGLDDTQMACYAFATIRPETRGFEPIPEHASGEDYEFNERLGNTEPGDGPRYKGRGFIQLTGRKNYIEYGAILGLDLVNNPDLALEPVNAARIMAAYLKKYEVELRAALDAGDLAAARAIVNGGTNGLDEFSSSYETCMDLAP